MATLTPTRNMNRINREAAKKKKAPPAVGYCGARKQDGSKCRQKAGAGTDHFGVGRCKHHGGATKNQRLKHHKDAAVLMGAPKDMNPVDALMWCIRITAGEVEFCTEQMAALEKSQWTETTLFGKQLHMWAKERQNAVDRLAKFSKDAISLGIAERAVRIAELYGHSIARLLRGILEDLELTPDQVERAPHIVRKHLALLEGSRPDIEVERQKMPELPSRVAA